MEHGPGATQNYGNKPALLERRSISSGISDATLKELLMACGPINSFTRGITPACNPRAFAITEFEEPDAVLHALRLLHNVELPALEDGYSNKHLLIKVDEKTCTLLDAYEVRRTLKPSAEAVKAENGTVVVRLQAEAKDRAEARSTALFRYQEHICEAERTPRIHALNEAIEMLRAGAANEAQSRIDMRAKLAAWDDDESDDLFYTDRSRWRALRALDLAAEEASPDGFVHSP
ncbi:hypothetical protein B0H13DRAFT_2330271 [Mycena leptocephala]|nr:hypothetical protein B0H13DRAFT_2330271 [Mycena leptocephala]